MRKDRRAKAVIIFSTVILFFALVAFIVLLIPRINTLKEISSEVAKKKMEYEVGLYRVSLSQKAVDTIAQAKQESDLLGIAIPQSPKADEAIIEVSAAAKQSGLDITSAEVIKAKEGILSISFGTRGNYDNTIGFLGKLKNNLRPVKIVDMVLTKTSDDKINASYNLDFPYLYQAAKSPVATQQVVE